MSLAYKAEHHPDEGAEMNQGSFTYRLRRTSWGLIMRVHYRWTPGPAFELCWTARSFDDGPARLERGFLRAGPMLGRLEISQVEPVFTDYQPEVFFLVGIGVAAEITRTEPNYPEITYDAKTNTYRVGP
ncbi:hypothetical protein L6R49_04130 [Myxococcota bacterium]|nr:hypothetical protein [Myxococcota bacterium]